MRAFTTTAIVLVLLIAACGGEESADTAGTAEQQGQQTQALDPCSLADEDILATYFGDDVPTPETATNGPIEACTWRDANANSLLIQTAVDFPLSRLEGCDACVDVPYGDDGYASPDRVQSTVKFVVGDMWYSATTTGFGDGAAEITDLGEAILVNSNG